MPACCAVVLVYPISIRTGAGQAPAKLLKNTVNLDSLLATYAAKEDESTDTLN